jgi:hypothetical protein
LHGRLQKYGLNKSVIKVLAVKLTEFHTYKPKKERSYRVMLKNMHYSINREEIKTEIEKLGYTVTNIWNIKQYGTKLLLSMFSVELKPAPNSGDIFNIEYIQQCKDKKYIAQCAAQQKIIAISN